jgi:hydroxymethylpyrimidine pyrophosphatase-like HAD family hydrolase
MKTIHSELVTFFDIDDTLVMENPKVPDMEYIDVLTGSVKYGKKHKAHIEQLIKHKNRGFYIVVWSGNGYKHAEQIVKALGIEEYVDLCMSKPVKHWDDLKDANDILKACVYLEDK